MYQIVLKYILGKINKFVACNLSIRNDTNGQSRPSPPPSRCEWTGKFLPNCLFEISTKTISVLALDFYASQLLLATPSSITQWIFRAHNLVVIYIVCTYYKKEKTEAFRNRTKCCRHISHNVCASHSEAFQSSNRVFKPRQNGVEASSS